MQTQVQIKVRGYHLDIYGHVNNARFLEFLEEGRWDFLERQADIDRFTQAGMGLAVVNININYRRAALVHDVLEISTCLSRIGGKSAVMQQVITHQATGEVVVDADVTFVVTDAEAKRAISLEGPWRELLESWQASPVSQ